MFCNCDKMPKSHTTFVKKKERKKSSFYHLQMMPQVIPYCITVSKVIEVSLQKKGKQSKILNYLWLNNIG